MQSSWRSSSGSTTPSKLCREGNAVLNGSADVTTVDIEGLCYISAMPGQLDPTEARALSQLKAQLTAQFAEDIAELLLYGSKARGDAGPDSDIDVLVVVRPGLRRAVGAAAAAIVSRLVCEGAPYLSVVVTDSERWSWETPFTRHVKRDALPL